MVVKTRFLMNAAHQRRHHHCCSMALALDVDWQWLMWLCPGYWNTFSCRIKSFRFTYGYYIVCMVECGETFSVVWDYCTCPGWQRQGCLHLAWLQTSEQPPTSLKCHFFFKGNLFVLRSEKRQEKNLGLLSVAFFVCKRKLQDFIYCSTKRPSGLSLFIPSVHLQLINLRLWSIVHSLKLYTAWPWCGERLVCRWNEMSRFCDQAVVFYSRAPKQWKHYRF